ncbi:MAG: PQQ-binding-like beta-propeller repeat protein [Chloroflexota bacterium]
MISNQIKIKTKPRVPKKALWLFLLLLLGVTLTGCSGARLASTSWPGILADGNDIYITYNQQIFSLDASDQQINWQYPTSTDAKSPSFYASPAVTDGILVVGGYNQILYGIDRINLQLKWTFAQSTGRYIGSPVVHDGVVYAATAGNEVFALDLAVLEQIGTSSNGGESRKAAEISAIIWQTTAKQGIWAAPLINNDVLYVASMDHHVRAYSASNGNELWSTELPGAVAGMPAISDDGSLLYVGSFDYAFYALKSDTGDIAWKVDAENWVWGTPVVTSDMVMFADLSGHVYVVDPDNGDMIWTKQVADAIRGPLAYDSDNNLLYIAGRKVSNPGSISTRGIVLAIDTTDFRVLWEQATDETIYTGPALNNDLLLVTPAQGEDLLLVFNAETGVLQWRYTLPGE